MDKMEQHRRKVIIGNPQHNFWLHDSTAGFDLTHPATPSTPTTDSAIKIKTVGQDITVDPKKSALVIVDMQNIFLARAPGRPLHSKGLKAQDQLLKHAIPAARKAGIRIVWLNWGLIDDDIKFMPPAIVRTFGFRTLRVDNTEDRTKDAGFQHLPSSSDDTTSIEPPAVPMKTTDKSVEMFGELGADMGQVTLEDGKVVEGGRLLIRGQWNTHLTPELSEAYEEGLKCDPPDVWIHKRRISGLWGPSNPGREFLDAEGIRTLFFAGVNTDQCVGGSLIDAFSEGYDCILLSDGAATSTPAGCQETYELNTAVLYGFCTSCKDLWEAVEG